jgi:hypothetical protein
VKGRILPLLLTLITAEARAQDTSDAYVNEAARELVRLARVRRNTVDRRIEAYGTTARERISAGLRAGIAEKLIYQRETVTRIDWQRDGPVRMEVVAARELAPLIKAEPQAPEDLSDELAHLAFDPISSEMLLRYDSMDVRHPLAEGGEIRYRYEAGDTTIIQLQDGRTVRLRELRVIPRRREPDLINGSLWLDMETYAVVQAYFKLARPLDDRDISVSGGSTGENIIAGIVTGFMKPMRAELDFVAIEYGLYDLRWWLPRRLAAQGFLQVNRFRIPMTYERTYEAYTVRGDTSGVLSPSAEPMPRSCRQRVSFVLGPGGEVDTVRQAQIDSARARQLRYEVRRRARGDTTAAQPECARELIVSAPADSILLRSSELPPDAYGHAVALLSDDELRAIVDRVRALSGVPWSFQPPGLQWGLIRYNRVEALSLGARLRFDLGPVMLGTEARVGIADRDPRGEAALERHGALLHSRLSGYRRLQPTLPAASGHGTLATLGALLFGRDDADYFDATGAELLLAPPESRHQWYDLRFYAERQRAVERNTDFSIAHVINSRNTFRENFTADTADQIGARLRLRAAFGLNPTFPRLAGEFSLDGETGDYRFVRSEALIRASTPLPFGLALGIEGAAGTVEGDSIPAQALWRLGGVSTLRGYPGSARVGERYWRTRTELGRGMPAARLSVFSDAAWAGARNRFDSDDALISAGVGASFLDGLLRVDLARAFRSPTGWRLHVHFSGTL